ncbi:hypothetical protein YPPY66_3766 [Yersinia pestis PY-66]|uniref:Uncharacterized protein n=1 Tax=Yersinia pestis PY-08 TaxID=992134 RepID=A0AB72ZH22_YERPE|nr:hypothetical protein YPC_1348 [Yersinia pestis biovar Medievalis str. Harbin 35]EDR42238.1 hypothetical protein YpE1979001_0865 [Yersinia pestis biovar Antiqua str. E1979001]EDR50747.1 hypothetical protein YpB42003004_0696 [Yersinia pestis biovar Antiqua str. B42003004]EEO77806.1 hypothetical protein YP516_1493 [Yersinia pestis Nepal516]EEO79666.1 hypothetical protein YPF_3655 [Yersinia pestis biovar Orientalis str. India 195]EEO85038.1 hypothetical protein YPH_0876 [Yersinia pestis biovar 
MDKSTDTGNYQPQTSEYGPGHWVVIDEGDAFWPVSGKSWHGMPVTLDNIYELKK